LLGLSACLEPLLQIDGKFDILGARRSNAGSDGLQKIVNSYAAQLNLLA